MEAQHLRTVVAEWQNQMAKAKTNWIMADFCFQQVLLPKLTYALIATDFMEQQCHEILKPVLTQALPTMGLNQHFLRVVAHGPLGQQGLALPNLFIEQVSIHIGMMIRFGHQQNDPTRQLLWANTEAF